MTTDFVLTIDGPIGKTYRARTIKPSVELAKPRTLQKFEIERRYWAERGIDWGIVTEREYCPVVADNLWRLYPHQKCELSPRVIQRIRDTLQPDILALRAPLTALTSASDAHNNLPPGTSLLAAYHLLATRRWDIDLSKPLRPASVLRLTSYE